MPRKTKVEKTINEVNQILSMIAEDNSVPRNIRRAAKSALDTMRRAEGTAAHRASNAMSLLDDVAQDPNCPLHARTRIYQALSRLETIRD